jgi:hypothetical protein
MKTKEFENYQNNLRNKIKNEKVRYIELDPDGTDSKWIGVIVEHQTGIIYGHQCGGTSNMHYLIEGFYVPVGGAKIDIDDGYIEVQEFTKIFHIKKSCSYAWPNRLPDDRINNLKQLVSSVPFWDCKYESNESLREALEIDDNKIGQACEGFIPVLTAQGKGVLVWSNCD